MEKEAVLTVSDLSLYYSKKKALNTINMTFYKNEITALIGPS
ncbi:phosphate ABC transporter ATP-binding protein, partial [Bacillus cereus]